LNGQQFTKSNVTFSFGTYCAHSLTHSQINTKFKCLYLSFSYSFITFSFSLIKTENTKLDDLLAWGVISGTVFLALGGIILATFVSCRKKEDTSQRGSQSRRSVTETTPLLMSRE
jgi:hypothetical protein